MLAVFTVEMVAGSTNMGGHPVTQRAVNMLLVSVKAPSVLVSFSG